MQRVTWGTMEVLALVDNVMAYPGTAVYPEAEKLEQYRHYLDEQGDVALNFGASSAWMGTCGCWWIRDGGQSTRGG
jgi:hypothetical protein